MFDITISPSVQFASLSLGGLWAFLLFGGLAYPLNDTRTHRIPTWRRMASSFVLVISACVIAITQSQTPYSGYFNWIAIGMLAGFIGDLYMAKIIGGKNHVILGMLAFGIGHILYIQGLLIAFQYLEGGGNLQTLHTGLIIGLASGVMGWFMAVYWRNIPRQLLHYIALPYSLVLASTGGLALGLGLQISAFMWVAIGAGLFLLSDLILSLELFRGVHFDSIGDIVWLTYGPGQMLIVLGLLWGQILL